MVDGRWRWGFWLWSWGGEVGGGREGSRMWWMCGWVVCGGGGEGEGEGGGPFSSWIHVDTAAVAGGFSAYTCRVVGMARVSGRSGRGAHHECASAAASRGTRGQRADQTTGIHLVHGRGEDP